MADDVPFGALDANQNWQDQEAQDNLAAIEAAKTKPKRSWYDTANDVAHMPGRMLGALTSSPASPEADQAAMMPETFVNPLFKNTADAVGGAIGSGATAPGDALAGKIPQYDADGHTSPDMIRRGFDTAAVAGGGSVAGTAEKALASPGTDLRVLGKQVLASDSGKPGAAAAAADRIKLSDLALSEHGDAIAKGSYAFGGAPKVSDAPISVSKTPDGQNYLLDGYHRVEAARRAGQADLPVNYVPFDEGIAGRLKDDKLLSDSKPGAAIAAAEHAPPFYSGLEKAVAEHPQEVMPASQWAGTLANKPGVKPEELKYTGTSDMLAAKGDAPVTKAELQDHLENNKVQLGEVTKSTPKWEDLPGQTQNDLIERWDMSPADTRDHYEGLRADGAEMGFHNETRYDQFQLPGPKENYREKLLTLPPKENGAGKFTVVKSPDGRALHVTRDDGYVQGSWTNDGRADTMADAQGHADNLNAKRLPVPDDNLYRSSHWDEPNVVAHLRMNDRAMSEPGYMVQNTKSGNTSKTFATPEEAQAYAESLPASVYPHTRIMDASIPKKSLHLEEIQSDWHQEGRKTGYRNERQNLLQPEQMGEGKWSFRTEQGRQVTGFGGTQAEATADAQRYLNGAPSAGFVPDAPFKKNWHELALKRALHEAAEGGYDRISWTPGESHPTNPKTLGRKGAEADAADRGMQGFYNKIIPDAMNKLGKPHGVQVQKGGVNPVWRLRDAEGKPGSSYVSRENGEAFLRQHPEAAKYWSLQPDHQPVHYMDIPPSLRQSLLTKGMPLFEDSSPGAAVAAASHIGEGDVAAGLRPGGGGGAGGVAEAQGAAARLAGAIKPLEGLPQKPIQVGGGAYVPGPNAAVHKVAEDYMASTGRPYERVDRYHPIDPEHAAAIAKAYEEMPHAPNDPKVKASYDAMVKETTAQYQALKKSGLKIEAIPPGAPDPYAESPRLAHKDVAENNHLWFFPTEGGFGTDAASGGAKAANAGGEHPLLQNTGEALNGRPLLANDLFRIVHDYFGHLKEGNGFRAAGEDNAFRTHSKMYSDLARPAMTTETRGQNSWLNYGPHGETNRTASAADTHYAEQKVGLMPDWTMHDPDHMAPLRRVTTDPDAQPFAGAKYPQYAESYPPVGPPRLMDKETGKPIEGKTAKASQKLVDQGKAYWGKQNTPEATAFQKDRGAIQKDMETKGYEPFFDPTERAHVDPANYPTSHDMTKDALPAKDATIDKYTKMFNTPAARKRLQAAFDTGSKIDGAKDWYAMRQLEQQYIKHLGPEEGQKRFASEFARTMAATTGGSDPTSNFLLAHYVQWASKNGHLIPEESHQLPFPIGGRYVANNVKQFKQMPESGFDANNPKRHDFEHAFLGHPNKATMDEQMSGGLVPGMQIPPGDSYGVAAQVVHDLAKKNGVHPRDFQDVAWAGLKKLKTEAGGKGFEYKGPMITDINDSIERTHRLTGMPKNDIVKRGLVKKEIPLYAGGPPVPFGSLDAKEDQ